jgi:hypothetical protein
MAEGPNRIVQAERSGHKFSTVALPRLVLRLRRLEDRETEPQ